MFPSPPSERDNLIEYFYCLFFKKIKAIGTFLHEIYSPVINIIGVVSDYEECGDGA